MKVKFDALNRFEVPKMYVCNPGCKYSDGTLTKVVGCLSDTTDEELILNFNAPSELNFRMYRTVREDANENSYLIKIYHALKNRRMIFVEGIGFFIISRVQDGYENELYFKDIQAKSCEVEIESKMLTYIEDGTYPFIDLLEKVVSTLPSWTIGAIDDNVSERSRTFENVSPELNTLAFMIDNMQDAYECIFVFDTINRHITVYSQDNYIFQTQIHLTKDDVINTIEVTENSEDLYTAISVLGDDNLNIAPINPLGTSVIYNFDYYMDWMSSGLKSKVEQWKEQVASYNDTYYDLNLEYYENLTKQSDLKSELEKIETQMTMYRRCKENIVAEDSTESVVEYNTIIEENGGEPISLDKELSETIVEIEDRISYAQDDYDDTKAELTLVENSMATQDEQIQTIHDQVSITKYFSEEEYEELYYYIHEGVYHDEYTIVTESMTWSEKFEQMKVLYDRAQGQLKRVSTPTQEFSIDVENFIFQKEFERWSDELETGCLINVELEEGDVAALFLAKIVVNYDDRSLTMTFGNRFNKFDPKSIFEDVMGDIQKSANTIDYIKDMLYPIKNGEFNAFKEALENSRNLTKDAALSSTNEEVVIDDTGYTGRKKLDNGEFDPRQIKITGRSIVFTDDAWDTCKLALGELIIADGETVYGLNAEAIFGQMIMGGSLSIVDSDGTPLLEVVDGKITATVDDKIQATVESIDGTIQSIVGEIDGKINSKVEQTVEGLRVSINSVTTTTGYTFGADGLFIHKDGDELTNQLDNTGMYVFRGEGDTRADILIANNQGVEALNLKSKQYLIVGDNSRFENYATDRDPHRTGCFFVGSR